MKILLTGGSGFVGKNIYNHLKGIGYDVLPISSKDYDLRNFDSCGKIISHYIPDIIVHAAGMVGGIKANLENPGKFMYDNLSMGINMIEQSRIHRSPKFIMLGTVCAYPKHTPVPFKESDLWNGYPEETNAPYGIAKKALMELGETYYEQYGMNVVNLIPVNMYGPHDHFNTTTSHVIPALIMKFIEARDNGETVELWGTGQASREFLHARDFARAVELAIKTNVSPEPINIGTGKEIKIIDLAYMIAKKVDYCGDIKFNGKLDGQPRRCLDTSMAKTLLGFESEIDLNEGLDETIEFFKKTC
jgi:GDP-L-fucose synthase